MTPFELQPQRKEIELWLTREMGSKIWVEYTLSDADGSADVTQQISTRKVLSFVKERELNWVYIIAPDVITELDAETYMRDNLSDVVKLYLIDQLCAA